MNAAAYELAERIMELPESRQAEVADFVEFLRSREHNRELGRQVAQASEARFQAVWDNDMDAEYDKL